MNIKRNLMLLTFLYLVIIMGFIFSPVNNIQKRILLSIENDPGRNEGSTPRTFVLPATPAVAREQEMKYKELKNKELIQKCMLKLIDNGFDNVGSFDDVFDFNTKLSIIKYQIINNIKTSGVFDGETKAKLDC